jgi:hypothetical protein
MNKIRIILLLILVTFLGAIGFSCKEISAVPKANQLLVGTDTIRLNHAYLFDYGVITSGKNDVYSKNFILSDKPITEQTSNNQTSTIILRTFVKGSKFKTGMFKLNGSADQYATFLFKDQKKNKEVSISTGELTIDFTNENYSLQCKGTSFEGQKLDFNYSGVFQKQ